MFTNKQSRPFRTLTSDFLAPAEPNVYRPTDGPLDRRFSGARCFLIWRKSLGYVSLLRSEEERFGKNAFYKHFGPTGRGTTGRGTFQSTVALLAVFTLAASTFAQQPANTSIPTNVKQTVMAPAASADDRYRIGPGDLLDIRFLNRPNLSRDSVRVEGNGMIRMPLIDTEIRAACKTEGELAKEISGRYLKFYRNPQIDVFVKEYRSVTVSIIGFVNDQGRFQLQRRIRLLELLTYAKGASARAGQTINIVHSVPALECQPGSLQPEDLAFSSYKLSDTLAGKPEANPYLQAGDIVTLPEADQIYVVGNVLSPRAIALSEPITLTQAIAMSGGVSKDSKKDKIRIVRQEPGSSTKKEIMVDLVAIEKKRAEDIVLIPNDIVNVQANEARSLLRGLIGGSTQSMAQLPMHVIP